MSSRKRIQLTDEPNKELESGFCKGLTGMCAENIEVIEDAAKQSDCIIQVVKVCNDVTKMQLSALVDIRCNCTLDCTSFLDKLIPMVVK